MAVASLVFGIIALVISIVTGGFGLGWIGSICGLFAIIFGAVARRDPEKRGLAAGGLVCGILALIWGLIATVACVACLGATGAALGGLGSIFN